MLGRVGVRFNYMSFIQYDSWWWHDAPIAGSNLLALFREVDGRHAG